MPTSSENLNPSHSYTEGSDIVPETIIFQDTINPNACRSCSCNGDLERCVTRKCGLLDTAFGQFLATYVGNKYTAVQEELENVKEQLEDLEGENEELRDEIENLTAQIEELEAEDE